jgi:hypothetical protein
MATKAKQDPTIHWTNVARTHLEGRTIKSVGYLTNEEANQLGWTDRSVMFALDNGAVCIVQSDDEGNNAGALYVLPNSTEYVILPTLTNDQYSFDLDLM